jgi:hypothetical protein
MSVIQCPECSHEIEVFSDTSEKCENCGDILSEGIVHVLRKKQIQVEGRDRENIRNYSILFVFLIILYFGLSKVMEPLTGNIESKPDYSSEAYYMSKKYVKEQLLSPSSSKFPFINNVTISHTGENRYIVSAYVDSKNGFGVEIRNNYICILLLTAVRGDASDWYLESLNIY